MVRKTPLTTTQQIKITLLDAGVDVSKTTQAGLHPTTFKPLISLKNRKAEITDWLKST